MQYLLIASPMLLCPLAFAEEQISFGFSTPGISIGINMPAYPDLILVPGMPVYCDPRVEANYFFYDGLYWVHQNDDWYDAPWGFVGPEAVPLFLLRVPVRFYRRPPMYVRGWRDDFPPRWGEHWGLNWEQHRGGWDHWDRNEVPHAAPLPSYQRTYSGGRYPRELERQRTIQLQNYHYQPRVAVEPRDTRPPPERQEHQQQRPNHSSGQHEEKARPKDHEAQGKNDGKGNRDDRGGGNDH